MQRCLPDVFSRRCGQVSSSENDNRTVGFDIFGQFRDPLPFAEHHGR